MNDEKQVVPINTVGVQTFKKVSSLFHKHIVSLTRSEILISLESDLGSRVWIIDTRESKRVSQRSDGWNVYQNSGILSLCTISRKMDIKGDIAVRLSWLHVPTNEVSTRARQPFIPDVK